ncbi:MAG: BrnT family toxin [Planctomycetota bacterium]
MIRLCSLATDQRRPSDLKSNTIRSCRRCDRSRYDGLDEIREIVIGHSVHQRMLLVSFTERGDDLVRIISARKATKRERRDYEEGTRS